MHNDGRSYGPPWTVIKLISWTRDYFTRHQVENPRASAEILLAFTLKCRRIDLYLQFDQPLHEDELSRYRQLIKRRVRHEPVAYITGEKEFWSLNFKVTPAVLIPRPETEILVEKSLELLPSPRQNTNIRIWEPGTGSGAVIISLAHERPDCKLFASDLSVEAIAVASQNARQHQVRDRVSFFTGNWSDPLHAGRALFDLIVCNPPYVKSDEIECLQPDVKSFEPRHALDGGADGLQAVTYLIHTAPSFIKSRGFLTLEIGYDQHAQVADIGYRCGAYDQIQTVKDYNGHHRVVCMRKR